MPGTAEPNQLPFLRYRLDNVVALSPLPNPTTVVQAGQPVGLRLDMGVDGLWAGFVAGEQYRIVHHCERIEDGVRKTLSGGIHNAPAAPPALTNFTVTTGPYSTANEPAVADLTIPVGQDSATWRILTHIHFLDPAKEPIVAAFNEMVIMIT